MPTQRTHSHQPSASRNQKKTARKPAERKQAREKDVDDLDVRNVAEDEEDRGDREQHTTDARAMTSGTLASFSERGHGPVADSGVSVDPDDLGTQFLRDATEQDNFESEVEATDPELGDLPIGQVISKATLEAAGQETASLPDSGALLHESDIDDEGTQPSSDVELTSPVIHQASLFDEQTEKGGTRAPRIETDEMRTLDEHDSAVATDPEEREREKAEARRRLHRTKDRRDIQADAANWQDNRHSPNERPRETSSTPGMKPGARGKRE